MSSLESSGSERSFLLGEEGGPVGCLTPHRSIRQQSGGSDGSATPATPYLSEPFTALEFTTLEGRTPTFINSHSSFASYHSDATTASSLDSIWMANRAHFEYRNLGRRHVTWELVTVAVLLVGYAGHYCNVSHLYMLWQPLSSAEGLSLAEASAVFWTVAPLLALSKAFWGLCCDYSRSGKLVFLATCYLTAVFSLLLCVPTQWALWMSVVGVALFNPGTWAALIAVVAKWIPRQRQGRVMAAASAVYQLGDVAVVLVVDVSLHEANRWQLLVACLAVAAMVVNLPAFFLLHSSPVALHLPEPIPRTLHSLRTASKPSGLLPIVKPLLKNRAFWLAMLLAFEVYGAKQFFYDYSFDYAKQCYCRGVADLDACLSSAEANRTADFVSLVFPIAGVVSTALAGYLKDVVGRRHRCSLLFTFLSSLFLFLVAMWFFEAISTVAFAAVFNGLCGFALMGPYSLLAGAFALDIGGKYRSATVSSFIDACGMVATAVILFATELYGPAVSIPVIIALVFCSLVTAALLWVLDLKRKGSEKDPEAVLTYLEEGSVVIYEDDLIPSSDWIGPG